MNAVFYVAAGVAVMSTVGVIASSHAVHALGYFVVSLLAVAIILLLVGAPLAAAFEAIVYAGAIIVLLLFGVMLLGIGRAAVSEERQWIRSALRAGPFVLGPALVALLAFALWGTAATAAAPEAVGPDAVSTALWGPYAIGVETASLLLIAGLVGALHVGRRIRKAPR